MAFINVRTVVDALGGTTPAVTARFTAVASRARRPVVRFVDETVTFPTTISCVWVDGAWDADPELYPLPADCYWHVRIESGAHTLRRNVILPNNDGTLTDFEDLLDVDPSTVLPDTDALAAWSALRQYVTAEISRLESFAADPTLIGASVQQYLTNNPIPGFDISTVDWDNLIASTLDNEGSVAAQVVTSIATALLADSAGATPEQIAAAVEAYLTANPGVNTAALNEAVAASDAFTTHVADTTPHPAYDDLPSLTLLFENGLI